MLSRVGVEKQRSLQYPSRSEVRLLLLHGQGHFKLLQKLLQCVDSSEKCPEKVTQEMLVCVCLLHELLTCSILYVNVME